MDVQFCVDALDDALSRHGAPEIFNTDQGSQFTSWTWTQRLKEAGVRISMDGRGRFLDNIFIERLWRSLKYECIYLHAFLGGRAARQGIGDRIISTNHRRPHAAHGGETPVRVYRERLRLPDRACARLSTRQPWWRTESDMKPDRQARIVA